MRTLHTLIGLSAFTLVAASSNAATLISTGFESGGLSPWTVTTGNNGGLYEFEQQLVPSGFAATNFASAGTFAAGVAKSSGTMTSDTFDLSGGGASESFTFNLAAEWVNATSTRRAWVEFSPNGGTSWFGLATLQQDTGAGTVTVTEGSTSVDRTGIMRPVNIAQPAYDGSEFTSNMIFRVFNGASAGADVRVFIDDTLVTTSIPEPSAALLGAIGFLALLRRRR